jgi:hypothetical protein
MQPDMSSRTTAKKWSRREDEKTRMHNRFSVHCTMWKEAEAAKDAEASSSALWDIHILSTKHGAMDAGMHFPANNSAPEETQHPGLKPYVRWKMRFCEASRTVLWTVPTNEYHFFPSLSFSSPSSAFHPSSFILSCRNRKSLCWSASKAR